MKINSAQLEAFYSIAKTLNFTKAAGLLHVTQSALSQRIAKLEEDLETTLFIREPNFLRLTEAGEHVLRFCQLNFQAESELLSKIRNTNDELAGVISIGGFSSVNRSLVLPSIKKIMQKYPKLSLNLITKELSELPQLLKTAHVDYIVTNQPANSEELESVYLGTEDNVLVKSKKLTNTDVYLDHDESHPTLKYYSTKNKLKLELGNIRYLDDVYGLLDGAKAGLGKAILPIHLIQNESDLEIINPQNRLSVPVYLKYYKQPFYRKSHAILVEAISEHFKKNLKQ